jgi:hypothetical protein
MLYDTPVSFIAKLLNKKAYMLPPISLCHFLIFAMSVTTTEQLVLGFFFLAAKYGGRTCGWWLVANTPTRGFPSVFCSQKKEPWL